MELQQEKDYFRLFPTVFRPFSTVFRPPRLKVRNEIFAPYIECACGTIIAEVPRLSYPSNRENVRILS